MPTPKLTTTHPAKELTPVILKAVRSNISKGYRDVVGTYPKFRAAKRDVWRLLIVIDRLTTEGDALKHIASPDEHGRCRGDCGWATAMCDRMSDRCAGKIARAARGELTTIESAAAS